MSLAKRKGDHIRFAGPSQLRVQELDRRFDYEPLFSSHPTDLNQLKTEFLDHKLGAPLWISSMTGGTDQGKVINKRLAKAAKTFGLGMGLGSCRPILKDTKRRADFAVRKIIGNDLPLFANLGVAQVDELLRKNQHKVIQKLVDDLEATGLIIHINPLQEFIQLNGDRFVRPPLVTLTELTEVLKTKIIVKEVGQGMGPKSLSHLSKLRISAIDFAAFGGTNFSQLETMRNNEKKINGFAPLATVGHSAEEMITTARSLKLLNVGIETIISGGIRNFLDGHYYLSKMGQGALYGMGYPLLKVALKSERALLDYVNNELEGLSIAKAFLRVKER